MFPESNFGMVFASIRQKTETIFNKQQRLSQCHGDSSETESRFKDKKSNFIFSYSPINRLHIAGFLF
ncbi:hypothetical protein BC643_4352 [Mangrovibacterium diazotrophicum]|uniref:Uncharacterized protein n=1 Tax=Mangrovibacterium diazotrophicum TaxID=1261403 RepID=A0A419VVF1_9BACT|nr:hypothetical protein BC643_4352 [Mangrovibacterium diazotrophicum]